MNVTLMERRPPCLTNESLARFLPLCLGYVCRKTIVISCVYDILVEMPTQNSKLEGRDGEEPDRPRGWYWKEPAVFPSCLCPSHQYGPSTHLSSLLSSLPTLSILLAIVLRTDVWKAPLPDFQIREGDCDSAEERASSCCQNLGF